MSSLRITVGGRDYQVSCDDGQEEHLRRLAHGIDERIATIGEAASRPGDPQLLLFAALMLADELEDARDALQAAARARRQAPPDPDAGERHAMESAFCATVHDIATRVEAIAEALETE